MRNASIWALATLVGCSQEPPGNSDGSVFDEGAGSFVAPGTLEVPDGPLMVAAVHLTETETGFGVGDTVTSETLGADGGFEGVLPDDVAPYLVNAQSSLASERYALFMLGVFSDTNRDRSYQIGEPVLGALPEILLYVDGGVSLEFLEIGCSNGWNLWDWNAIDQLGLHASPMPATLYIHPNLVPTQSGPLQVQLPFEFGPDVLVDLYTTEGELGRPPANPILATATVNGTSATLDEPAEPPEDHFAIDTDPGGLSFTTAAVFAYTDADGSGSYGAGEPIVATSDGGAYPVEAMYVLPTDLRGALYLATGLSAGWNLVADRGSDTPLFPDWAEGITLESY